MVERKSNQENWRTSTKLVRGGQVRSQFQETSEALFLTSGYVYDEAAQAELAFKGELDRYVYSRFKNPTVAMFEERMALLEGAEICHGTATGMAAVFATLSGYLCAGDRLVVSRALFGSCRYVACEVMPRYGIKVTVVDGTDLDQWRDALSRETKMVFIESPSNPTLEIIDIPAVAELAHKAGAKLVVDNVFATPVLQSPFTLGADIVVYSATKHIDGQGRCMGGAILCDAEFSEENYVRFLRNTGPALSPFNAWVLLKGLETLALRVEKHCANAAALAIFLEKQKTVPKLFYPGLASHPQHALAKAQMRDFGTVIAFEVDGGKKEAFRFLDALKLIDISNNLGDTKSLITHPATTTHQSVDEAERLRMGIGENLIRISVGLEDVEDLKEDLAQAFKAL
ncbi:MAG: O-succinylhomoserine sulfhydrylase [Rhodospirillaceae bacterium]|nr:MAG: O-succinylhomoserine sulfhydrylase [Rhodospirillaceae bacterium]